MSEETKAEGVGVACSTLLGAHKLGVKLKRAKDDPEKTLTPAIVWRGGESADGLRCDVFLLGWWDFAIAFSWCRRVRPN